MQISEYRSILHQEIDALNSQNLAKVFGLINNLKNELNDDDIWLDTTKPELKLILEGLSDLENNRTITNNDVMTKMRSKVANA